MVPRAPLRCHAMIMLRCAGGGLLVVFNIHTALNIYAGKVNNSILCVHFSKNVTCTCNTRHKHEREFKVNSPDNPIGEGYNGNMQP